MSDDEVWEATMISQMKRAMVLAITGALLAACDPPADTATSDPTAAAAAPAASAPASSTGISASEVADLCRLAHAVTVGAMKGAGRSPCQAELSGNGIKLTSADGVVNIVVPVLTPGNTITLAQTNVSPKAHMDAATQTWDAFSAVFAVAPTSGPYCVKAKYIAPNGTANSLFVVAPPKMQSIAFNLPVAKALGEATLEQSPFAASNSRTYFAILPREVGTLVGEIGVVDCVGSPT